MRFWKSGFYVRENMSDSFFQKGCNFNSNILFLVTGGLLMVKIPCIAGRGGLPIFLKISLKIIGHAPSCLNFYGAKLLGFIDIFQKTWVEGFHRCSKKNRWKSIDLCDPKIFFFIFIWLFFPFSNGKVIFSLTFFRFFFMIKKIVVAK